MQRATISLSNGHVFEFMADEVSITKRSLSNELTGISWKGIKEGSGEPLWIDIDSVVAVMAEEVGD